MKQAKKRPSEASRRITEYIAGHDDWRCAMLARIRRIVGGAVPEMTEEFKWATPVWSHHGLVCAASAFKAHVKVNFFQGASLKDPKGVFNAGLDAKAMRSVDFREGDAIDAAALAALVRAAAALRSTPRKGPGGRRESDLLPTAPPKGHLRDPGQRTTIESVAGQVSRPPP